MPTAGQWPGLPPEFDWVTVADLIASYLSTPRDKEYFSDRARAGGLTPAQLAAAEIMDRIRAYYESLIRPANPDPAA
jgi:hypothetical protein